VPDICKTLNKHLLKEVSRDLPPPGTILDLNHGLAQDRGASGFLSCFHIWARSQETSKTVAFQCGEYHFQLVPRSGDE
jgi:hypothetical protein